MSVQSIEGIMSQVIRVEKAGAEFYRRLAAEAKMPAAKEVLLGLAKDEVQHQKDFTDLAKAINGKSKSFESALNLTEIMSSVADKLLVIMKGSELVDMDEAGLKQALDLGIYNERESVRVYSELMTFTHPKFNTIILKVVEEESKHMTAIEKLKAQRLG